MFGDSWEADNEGEYECDECEEEFSYCREYEVTYISRKKSCEEKGREHDYKLVHEYDLHKKYVKNEETNRFEWVEITPTEHVKVYQCVNCEENEYEISPIEKKEEV